MTPFWRINDRRALAMSVLLVALSGYQQQEGPAEQAGKNVDHAVDKAGARLGNVEGDA
jgi:hypothetical protein